MVRLLEHEGKTCLRAFRMAVPRGRVVASVDEAVLAAEEIGPAVVKVQVPAGGRGRSGGMMVGDTPKDVGGAAALLFGTEFKGFVVRSVLVEEKLPIKREFYMSYTVNSGRDARCPMLMFSGEGGVDIENLPEERLARLLVSATAGPDQRALTSLLTRARVRGGCGAALAAFGQDLFRAYKGFDCFTLEVNPLVLTEQGSLIAADCKMEIDNNAVFRHPELGISLARDFGHEPTEIDLIGWGIEESDQRGSGFLMSMPLDESSRGYIGYHPIGGGSAMLGMDALRKVGLTVANYADTSGNPVASKIYRVAKAILSQPNIDGYLLGGFMMANQEQWHHAHAIVKALREHLPLHPGFPCVLLLCGNKEEESLLILHEGLKDVVGSERVEIYGRERVTDTEFIAGRLLSSVREYRLSQ